MKRKKRANAKVVPQSLNEGVTFLGITDVPSRQGNEICYYAFLLFKKMIENGVQKPEPVKLCVDENGILVRDSNNVCCQLIFILFPVVI